MKCLLVLGILIGCQLIAALTMLVFGTAWIFFDENARDSVFAGMTIGLFSIAAAILLPYGLLRWRRNG